VTKVLYSERLVSIAYAYQGRTRAAAGRYGIAAQEAPRAKYRARAGPAHSQVTAQLDSDRPVGAELAHVAERHRIAGWVLFGFWMP
jgi:hypothetical protein